MEMAQPRSLEELQHRLADAVEEMRALCDQIQASAQAIGDLAVLFTVKPDEDEWTSS